MCAKNVPSNIQWGAGRSLDFSKRALVMGIINCTPDSFYSGSRSQSSAEAVDAARAMVNDGADIVDIGGESTRPGSTYVGVDEEIARVVPVIEAIRRESDVVVSVDTRKAYVAEEALKAGADIVNDVSALRDDSTLAEIIAERDIPVILMHMRGTPETMQESPFYDDTVDEVKEWLLGRARYAMSKGIRSDSIIIDPGIGFGKRLQDNLRLIHGTAELCKLGFPVLIGLSRKSFIAGVLEIPVDERMAASLASGAYSVCQGAQILRVHDVRETVHLVNILSAIQRA